VYAKTLITRKLNIGTRENTKFQNIGDYWNKENIENIFDLLREYQNLFLTTLFIDEGGCWGARRDEDPFEARCQAGEAETMHIEPNV
jgi:hypothetical protein